MTRLNVPPFIATLGTLGVFTAVGLKYANGQTITPTSGSLLLWTGKIIKFGTFHITTGVLIMLVLYVVIGIALGRTAWGKHVYAVGDDQEASRLMGIPTTRVLFSVYVTAGLVYGIAAWVQIGRVGDASTNISSTLNLDSITAAVIGGISLFGGRGRRDRHAVRGVDRPGVPERARAGRRPRPVPAARRGPAGDRRGDRRPVDPEGTAMTGTTDSTSTDTSSTDTKASGSQTPVLQAKGLWKFYGRVAALRGADFELLPGEILAVIGDNGAGKSSLIKSLSGAAVPDEGEILLDGKPVRFRTPSQAKAAGIETVYQTLAVAPALDIAIEHVPGPRDPPRRPARVDLPFPRHRDACATRPRSR